MAGVEAKEVSVTEEADLISALPDPILGAVISLLPGTEGVRTCVLSKRWEMVWKQTSHLNFDLIQMLQPMIQANARGIYLNRRRGVAFNLCGEYPNKDNVDLDVNAKAKRLIYSVLDSHPGPLNSCTIRHLPESCVRGSVIVWIKKLLKQKKVKKLSLERSDDPIILTSLPNSQQDMTYYGITLDFPFEIFSSFEALELNNYYLRTRPSDVCCQVLRTLTFKNVTLNKHDWEGILSYCFCLENLTLDNCNLIRSVEIHSPTLKFFKICRMVVSEIKVSAINLEIFEIDTVVCKTRKLTFEAPKVQVLLSCCDSKIGVQYVCWVGSKLLQSKDTLHTCSSYQSPQGSTLSCGGIFEYLTTLCIDLDLRKVKNVTALFSALKSSPKLQNLEINSQVKSDAKDYNDDEHNDDNYLLPYPNILFWRRMESCYCIDHQLRNLSIRGFAGTKLEVEFLRYIIITAEVMKKITVWFVDDCSWARATETGSLLLFRRASPNLSIILNPDPVYMANVDGNFEKWISTLRN